MTEEELNKKQEESINKMKDLLRPGFYTDEEMNKISSDGAKLMAEIIDFDIVKKVIEEFKDKSED